MNVAALMKHNERHARWIAASFGFTRLQTWATVYIQGLGRLDIDLIERDAALVGTSKTNISLEIASMELSEVITLSHLWVLGAYELVRALNQQVNASIDGYSKVQKDLVLSTKHNFERIRMPLAKLEPASKWKSTDFSIAYPVLNASMGTAWHIANETVVTRRELSDKLLLLGCSLKEDQQ